MNTPLPPSTPVSHSMNVGNPGGPLPAWVKATPRRAAIGAARVTVPSTPAPTPAPEPEPDDDFAYKARLADKALYLVHVADEVASGSALTPGHWSTAEVVSITAIAAAIVKARATAAATSKNYDGHRAKARARALLNYEIAQVIYSDYPAELAKAKAEYDADLRTDWQSGTGAQ